MPCHPSHNTRFSDSSFYDEVCVNCGATDQVPGGWGDLELPCPKAPDPEAKARAEAYETQRRLEGR